MRNAELKSEGGMWKAESGRRKVENIRGTSSKNRKRELIFNYETSIWKDKILDEQA